MATQPLKAPVFFKIKEALHSHGEVQTKQLRSFGLIMATFFGVVLGFGPLILGHGFIRVWPLPIAGLFLVFSLFMPLWLRGLYQVWMLVGGTLGWVNTRILLGVVFFLLFTPIAVLRRALGKDSLGLKYDPQAKTYRIPITERSRTESGGMSRQF